MRKKWFRLPIQDEKGVTLLLTVFIISILLALMLFVLLLISILQAKRARGFQDTNQVFYSSEGIWHGTLQAFRNDNTYNPAPTFTLGDKTVSVATTKTGNKVDLSITGYHQKDNVQEEIKRDFTSTVELSSDASYSVSRDPVDIMLILDQSPSMNHKATNLNGDYLAADGSTVADPALAENANFFLKKAVYNFICTPQLRWLSGSQTTPDGDQIGVYSFDGNVNRPGNYRRSPDIVSTSKPFGLLGFWFQRYNESIDYDRDIKDYDPTDHIFPGMLEPTDSNILNGDSTKWQICPSITNSTHPSSGNHQYPVNINYLVRNSVLNIGSHDSGTNIEAALEALQSPNGGAFDWDYQDSDDNNNFRKENRPNAKKYAILFTDGVPTSSMNGGGIFNDEDIGSISFQDEFGNNHTCGAGGVNCDCTTTTTPTGLSAGPNLYGTWGSAEPNQMGPFRPWNKGTFCTHRAIQKSHEIRNYFNSLGQPFDLFIVFLASKENSYDFNSNTWYKPLDGQNLGWETVKQLSVSNPDKVFLAQDTTQLETVFKDIIDQIIQNTPGSASFEETTN